MSAPAITSAEPVISVTANAAGQIRHLAETDPANAGKFLRIYVEQGGCSGKQYGMVFDEKRADDFIVEMHEVSVLVDPVSAGHVRGAVVDFSDSLNAGGFKISNPNARQSCGCGKSFEA
jgi:iron-sulfur cluster assembly protein/iron-sulfur cluster insertion protein